jgi:hypothetical protein
MSRVQEPYFMEAVELPKKLLEGRSSDAARLS